MFDPVAREREILGTLEKFSEAGLKFVVIGGYAVSAYRHRFSIDRDIVIRKQDLDKFLKILKKNNYKKSVHKDLENRYSSEFESYEKEEPKTSIDLMIGAVVSRTTNASWSFDFLWKNSKLREIKGMEKSLKARIPNREVLIALKLHSGRLTDFRDVAALTSDLDLDKIQNSISRGNTSLVKENLKKLGELLEKQEFIDSFKGIFQEKSYRIDKKEIKKLVGLGKGL